MPLALRVAAHSERAVNLNVHSSARSNHLACPTTAPLTACRTGWTVSRQPATATSPTYNPPSPTTVAAFCIPPTMLPYLPIRGRADAWRCCLPRLRHAWRFSPPACQHVLPFSFAGHLVYHITATWCRHCGFTDVTRTSLRPLFALNNLPHYATHLSSAHAIIT